MTAFSNRKTEKRAPTHFKRLGRELAMQFLFQLDVLGARSPDDLELFWEQAENSGAFPKNRVFRKGREYAVTLISGVIENIEEIDKVISEHSEKWDMKRMAVVDRNVMRVAVYEMCHCMDVPPVVSIDEAVEIAKDFSSEKSGLFINGILNGVKDGLTRSPREACR
ncbi:MAG: transcription antitermination factor NusB [Lentisphaerae bacterium GWF2_44_16]|nr:MAG: transcription antitermination factor NusB [Lentisphaerae bacterium GWF2_44_16]